MSTDGDGAPSPRVRIVGIGSPTAGDDLGWRLAEALRAADIGRGFPDGAVDIVVCDHPGHLLLGVLAGLHLAIIVDAMRGGAAPGGLRRLDMDDLDEIGAWTSHGFGVAGILALGRALGVLPPRVVLYGIEAGPPACMPSPSVWVAQCEGALREEIGQALVNRTEGSPGVCGGHL